MMKKIETTFDKFHAAFTQITLFQIFTSFTRVLLGFAFIPPSITKILHHPFTGLPESNPVGAYFIALYNTGFYYDFIGWAQLTAAVLLLFPRTSHLGALAFFPIILNIAILTSSVGFKGTWLITILMSFAGLWLVCWEYDRLKEIIFRNRTNKTMTFGLWFAGFPLFFAFGGAAMALLFSFLRIGNLDGYSKVAAGLVSAGAVFGVCVGLHFKFMKVGPLDETPRSPDAKARL